MKILTTQNYQNGLVIKANGAIMVNVIKMMCLLELEEQLLKITQDLLNVILEMGNAMDK